MWREPNGPSRRQEEKVERAMLRLSFMNTLHKIRDVCFGTSCRKPVSQVCLTVVHPKFPDQLLHVASASV